jgi:hypothetical protein
VTARVAGFDTCRHKQACATSRGVRGRGVAALGERRARCSRDQRFTQLRGQGEHMKRTAFYAVIAMIFVGVVASSHSAHANGTCTGLITSVRNQLIAHGGAYNFDLTIHRTDIDEVEYSRGAMSLYTSTGYWALTGGATYQLFRDRYNGNQPFNMGAADLITPYVGSDGQIYIWYNTWGFQTQWDLGCTGNTITAIVPNVGVVTLTFRSWFTIG